MVLFLHKHEASKEDIHLRSKNQDSKPEMFFSGSMAQHSSCIRFHILYACRPCAAGPVPALVAAGIGFISFITLALVCMPKLSVCWFQLLGKKASILGILFSTLHQKEWSYTWNICLVKHTYRSAFLYSFYLLIAFSPVGRWTCHLTATAKGLLLTNFTVTQQVLKYSPSLLRFQSFTFNTA